MDEQAVAGEFGDRLTFLVGFDVQHLLREGTPDEVRAEVRYLIDTFDRPDGGMCLAAGNGIVAGTPFENIEAFLDEAVAYGAAHSLQVFDIVRHVVVGGIGRWGGRASHAPLVVGHDRELASGQPLQVACSDGIGPALRGGRS